jgi:hypothetical protein
VFAGRTAAGDTYDLRTLEQLTVEGGAEIIKPLGESEEKGDTIPFRSIVKNNSEGVPYTITGDGDAIEVTLQGADDSYTDPFGGSITFAGGLVTGFVSSDVEGKNLNLTIENLEYAAGEIVGSPYLAAILYFRGGVYIGMTDPEDEPDQLDEATVTRMIEGS